MTIIKKFQFNLKNIQKFNKLTFYLLKNIKNASKLNQSWRKITFK